MIRAELPVLDRVRMARSTELARVGKILQEGSHRVFFGDLVARECELERFASRLPDLGQHSNWSSGERRDYGYRARPERSIDERRPTEDGDPPKCSLRMSLEARTGSGDNVGDENGTEATILLAMTVRELTFDVLLEGYLSVVVREFGIDCTQTLGEERVAARQFEEKLRTLRRHDVPDSSSDVFGAGIEVVFSEVFDAVVDGAFASPTDRDRLFVTLGDLFEYLRDVFN